MKFIILIVLIQFGLGSAAHAAPRKMEKDTNKDGRPDQVAFFDARGRLERLEVDSNADGLMDRIQYYANQVILRVEKDTDFDTLTDCRDFYVSGKIVRQIRTDPAGQIFQITLFDENEKVAQIQKDSSGNGKFDLFYYFENGKLLRSTRDTNGNGRVNIRQSYADDLPLELKADEDEDSKYERIIHFGLRGCPLKAAMISTWTAGWRPFGPTREVFLSGNKRMWTRTAG